MCPKSWPRNWRMTQFSEGAPLPWENSPGQLDDLHVHWDSKTSGKKMTIIGRSQLTARPSSTLCWAALWLLGPTGAWKCRGTVVLNTQRLSRTSADAAAFKTLLTALWFSYCSLVDAETVLIEVWLIALDCKVQVKLVKYTKKKFLSERNLVVQETWKTKQTKKQSFLG